MLVPSPPHQYLAPFGKSRAHDAVFSAHQYDRVSSSSRPVDAREKGAPTPAPSVAKPINLCIRVRQRHAQRVLSRVGSRAWRTS